MSGPDQHPDLTGMLRGELSNADVLATGDHLDSCAACREELADLAVGHALLSSASRTVGPVPVGEQQSGDRLADRGRRRTRVLVGLAAAVAILAAAGAVVAIARDGTDPTPQRPEAAPTQVARLAALDGDGSGSVRMTEHGGEVAMIVETHDLPSAGAGHFYYLWLLDPATNKMLPLGVIGPAGTASFDLPRSLLGRYRSVDVSLESDDGDPAHSITSVLRGRYA